MGLSVAFDLATHRGYDSDHPRVVGDVGKAGVAIDSVEDMKILFDGIPLEKMSVSMTMNGAVLPVLAMFIVAGEEQGVDQAAAQRHHPERHPQGVHGPQHLHLPARAEHADRGRHHRVHGRATCRGSTRSRSPATTCRRPGRRPSRSWPSPSPTASSTCARRSAQGLDVDAFAGRLSFFFAIGMNFFMEVAKLRAARLLWHRVMTPVRAEEAAVADAAHALPDLGRVAHRAGPVQQRRAHRGRGAWPRCSAARRACTPTPSTRRSACRPTSRARIARNTQLILAEETGITHVVDPLGGSYYVEALTDDLADQGVGAHRGGRGARRHDQGRRVGHAEAAHRGVRRPPPGRASTAARRSSSASTSTCPTTPSMVDVLDIDNTKVREQQIARLEQVRADARRRGLPGRARRARPRAPAGDGNLLALCHRRRPGPGHRRRDLRRHGGRCSAATGPRSVASPACTARPTRATRSSRPSRSDIEAFADAEGRRPRMLVVKMGQDGHDRGAKVDRHRVRRPRLRRRRRPAVPDAGRGRPRRRRERRARRRRVEPGRRAQDARARSSSTSCQGAGAGDIVVVVRRRHPAAGLRRPATTPAWPPSSARAPTSPRPRRQVLDLVLEPAAARPDADVPDDSATS